MTERTAIIGAGFSGLACAWLLERLLPDPPEILIFEAAPSTGGRIRTDRFREGGIPYEAGCAEMYDISGSPQLRGLVDTLELSTSPLEATPSFLFDGKVFQSEEDFYNVLGPRALAELQEFWRSGTRLRPREEYARAGQPRDNHHPWFNRSFEDVLSRISDSRARNFTAVQVHSDLATEPALATGLFGFDNLLIDHPEYCGMYTVDEGNQQLTDRLRASLSARILLSTPVLSVAARGGRNFRLRFGEKLRPRFADVDTVVVTPPPLQLRHIEWSGLGLGKIVARLLQHHRYWTDYLRVTLLFEERFWAETYPEDYLVADAFDGVTIYECSPRNSRRGVLSWLLAGSWASRLAKLPDEEIFTAVRDLFPPGLDQGTELVREYRVDRWTGEWGVSRKPGGFPLPSLRARHCPSPRLSGLLFAGDYLYDATLSGAFDAACYVVQAIVDRADRSREWRVKDVANHVMPGRLSRFVPTSTAAQQSLPFLNVKVA